ncbi:MAG TPA: LuxR C-terminal-related transcriptional regulator [Candidatus Limnocylindria bacterium]|nr:LuxR C-terminal-related transcriptional regulator [Candidatus Limnocylindria bacterium]
MGSVLSEERRRVLDLLSVGLAMHDVAQLLRISDAALRAHVAGLLEHYGAEDRTTLVAMAYRRGDAPGLRRLARSVALTRGAGRS